MFPIKSFSRLFVVLAGALVTPALTHAENWPGWRGPTGQGHTTEKDLPLKWDHKTGENILWKTLLHGGGRENPEFSSPGWSSPIVWNDRIFVTTAVWPAGLSQQERRSTIAEQHVLCFKTSDGKLLWDTIIPSGKIVVDNFYHGYNVPTPITDGERVYALFASGILAALDFDGKIVWQEELPRVKGEDSGECSSPILFEDSVIIPGLQQLGLRALLKKNGQVKWEQQTKFRNTMATPALVRVGDKTQLIHFAAGAQGVDPRNGDVLWTCKAPTSQSSPVIAGSLLYADAGRGGMQGALIDMSGMGDVSKSHVKWQTRVEGASGSSAIIVGKRIYRSSSPDTIKCLDLDTGDTLFAENATRLSPSASPIATPEGRIYFAGSGKSYVIQEGEKFDLLAVNDLADGAPYSTPAVSNGCIFIKGKSYLWCIGKK